METLNKELQINAESLSERSIGSLVAENFQKADVFKKYKIDFCCGGKKTLAQACKDKHIDLDQITDELIKTEHSSNIASQNFNNWDPAFLADYIVNTHHRYVKSAIPLLLEYTRKVARVHGHEHPEVIQIAELFDEASNELTEHMHKEEQILFPYIKQIASALTNSPEKASFGSVKNPINMMEHEHDHVGKIFHTIAELSSNYNPPASACATYKVSFLKLQEFEEDLHQHIHLENNILFPKSIALEQAIENKTV